MDGYALYTMVSYFLLFIIVELLRPVFGSSGLEIGPTVLLLGCLFSVVLVHEFGHCLACRWSGGSANEILMWPLGVLLSAYHASDGRLT